jgi:hypothetical protein
MRSERHTIRCFGSTGRFLSPDPSGLYFANPLNPQSLNLYSYAHNNPLKNTDPTGLDCVYLNDEGTGVQSVDHNSSFGECVGTDANGNPNGSNGGYWINGNVNGSGVTANADTGQVAYGNAAVYSIQNGVLEYQRIWERRHGEWKCRAKRP